MATRHTTSPQGFSFTQKQRGVPVYGVYDTRNGGHRFLGSVKKSRETSGTATRWKADGLRSSDGHVTREHAAMELRRMAEEAASEYAESEKVEFP